MTQQAQAMILTTPVGRIVQGDVYQEQVTDMEGKPLVVKNGPNAGKPTKRWYFALAIPKTPGLRHWAEEEWGKQIWARGFQDFPMVNGASLAQRQDFAWKIVDGDSTMPNQNNRKPADMEGWKGCWVLKLSSGFAPKTYNADGTAPLEAGAIKPGYYVQACLTVQGNEDSRKPGMYLNPTMVALSGFGAEISFGPDPSQAGFGKAPLPPGASSTPPASFTPPAAAPAPATAPAPQAAPPHQPPPPTPMASAPAPAAPVPPGPHAAMAPPPPAATGRQMTAKANGVAYEQYRQSGWTDEQLVAHGMMTP